MIITILTWGIMGFVFSVYGVAINFLIRKLTKYDNCNFFDCQWFGIVITTVYAQFFSLFYKIGMLAFLVLVCGAILLILFFKAEYITMFKNRVYQLKDNKKESILKIIILGIILFLGSLFTLQTPEHYDTYLYHAQNLRWIEEYGIVKGLGNFHNRFAYNSSFMCLQALFSFVWCLSQSLHTLNGFLWIFMMSYVVCNLKIYNINKIFISDIFKFLALTYLCNSEIIRTLSSPHTDMMTMLLVIYIITRWVEYLEQGEKEYTPYGILCLLGVFSVSVKLSAALVLILVLKPAIELVRKKKWGVILGFIISGIIIILPFLIRNIILSGYLVYPYASIDFLNVDWKMPASQVIFDNHEIIAWGRRLNDVDRYSEPITVWLPLWLEKSGMINSCLMLLNIILLPITVWIVIQLLIKKKYDESLVMLCCAVLFCGWLFTAPLPRYGTIYMFLLPIVYVFIIIQKNSKYVLNKWKFILSLCIIIVSFDVIQRSANDTELLKYGNKLYPRDYNKYYSVDSVSWGGLNIYIPNAGDQVSYDTFPSTPYASRLDLIELRGEELEQGFRIKEEYRNRKISTYGSFLD